MNVFDCHVNRSPCSGKVSEILYKPGKFFNASLDKASEYNERNYYTIKNNNGEDIIVVQIAGLIARRIKCDLKINQQIAQRDGGNIIANNNHFQDVSLQGNCIGKNTVINKNVEILNSVLWENVHVQENVKIEDSIIADGVTIGEGATIESSVLASGSTVPPRKHLKPGTHLLPGERYDETDG